MDPFDSGMDMLKSFGEQAKRLGKSMAKEVKKAAGLHVGVISEANPRYYVVIAKQGAMVRKGVDLDSPQVHGLRRGDMVTVVDVSGRRARVIDPVEGWISMQTAENEPILEATLPPDKKTQVAAMERRFERLKAEQTKDGEQKGNAPTAPQSSESMEPPKASSVAPVSAIKNKLVFKQTDMLSVESTSVPKLSGPGGFLPPPPAGPRANIAPPATRMQAAQPSAKNDLDDIFAMAGSSTAGPPAASATPLAPADIFSLMSPEAMAAPPAAQQAAAPAAVVLDPFAGLSAPKLATPPPPAVPAVSNSGGLDDLFG